VTIDQGDPFESMVRHTLGRVQAEVDEVVGLDVDGAGEVDVMMASFISGQVSLLYRDVSFAFILAPSTVRA